MVTVLRYEILFYAGDEALSQKYVVTDKTSDNINVITCCNYGNTSKV